MKKISLLLLALCTAGANTSCTSTPAATQADVESVKRRLTSMEARLRQLEAIAPDPKPAKKGKKGKKDKKGAGGGKKAAGGGKKKRRRAVPEGIEVTPMVDVGLRGDANKVLIVDGANRYPIPSVVPPGDYEIHAAFEANTLPEKLTTMSTGENSVVVVECSRSSRSCDVTNR